MATNKLENIILIGYMGTGKTTIAKNISEKLNMQAIDIDSIIEKQEGRLINDIFLNAGEKYFRNMETDILKKLKGKNNIVVACGGGIVLKDENINYLKLCGRVVLLKSTAKTIYNRIKNCNMRPILNNNMNIEFIENMIKKRNNNYMKAKDIVVINEDKSIDEVTKEIIRKVIN